MDANRFDSLVRTFSSAAVGSRRHTLGALLGGSLALLRPASPHAQRANANRTPCARRSYDSRNFVGKKITADVQFIPALKAIDACASQARGIDDKFQVHINSSYRDQATNAAEGGASGSAHVVGHAIDFRLHYTGPNGQVAECRGQYKKPGVGCLGQPFAKLPAPVKEFLSCVRSDHGNHGLRWGGDWKAKAFDPVHIDDGLTLKGNPKRYRQRLRVMEESGSCGRGKACCTKVGSPQAGWCGPKANPCRDRDEPVCPPNEDRVACGERCCAYGDICCDGQCKSDFDYETCGATCCLTDRTGDLGAPTRDICTRDGCCQRYPWGPDTGHAYSCGAYDLPVESRICCPPGAVCDYIHLGGGDQFPYCCAPGHTVCPTDSFTKPGCCPEGYVCTMLHTDCPELEGCVLDGTPISETCQSYVEPSPPVHQ